MIKKSKSSAEKAADTKTTTSSTSQRIEKNLYRQTTIRIDKDGNEVIASRYIVKKQVKGRPLYKSFPDKKSAKAALAAVRTGELKPSASKKNDTRAGNQFMA